MDSANGSEIISLISRYIYSDSEVLDRSICEALASIAGDQRARLVEKIDKIYGGDSTTEYETSDDDVPDLARRTSSERYRVRKALAPGQCYRCHVQETPQWRYVHHLRFCNACYMRIKRYTEQARPGSRLPPRAKQISRDDSILAQLAIDLTEAAFA